MQSIHGGNIWQRARETGISPRKILDFSANINPIGPPDCLRSIICGQIENLVHYPDPGCSQLTGAIAGYFGIDPQQIVCGNGSSELLYAIPRALNAARVVLPAPCYVDYARAARAAGIETVHILPEDVSSLEISFKRLESELRGNEIVFIGQPNNPTGLLFDKAAFINLAAARHDTFVVVDEAFADFIEDYRSVIHHNLPNVLVLRSMTKFFAIPGLRLGALLGPADKIVQIGKTLPFWSVNHLAQAAGIAFLADKDYMARTRRLVQELREELRRRLSSFPEFFVYPGTANYLLVRIDHNQPDALTLQEKLLRKGIVIRVCDNFVGLDKRFFRVAVRTEKENERLCDAIAEIFGMQLASHENCENVGQGPLALPKKERRCGDARALPVIRNSRTPALMLQGTSSWAGKSILTAAFCRILLQDGYRVAPFKAQNMSLNSFVTLDGGEIGRAQALQAQACRLEPDVRMNPILLKPNSDTGTQVIVLGKPVGNMDVNQYIRFKPEVFETVKQAYDQLASEYDVIVLEGAGSPAEVNLKSHDIVNMSMAQYAGAKVLIVGDIDRGGVFASFAGTFDLLDNWERELVAGFIVNRFRGDAGLLTEALDFIGRYTGRPILGVVPYLKDLQLPEEDSVTFKIKGGENEKQSVGKSDTVTIAVIDLPHISNFTDFDALRLEPDVVVRFVCKSEDLGAPDVIILPGSKNVPKDMAYLRTAGFEQQILEFARNGKVEILGICAGLQMLGTEIHDPHHIESKRDKTAGLGVLPLTTTLCDSKTLTRVAGVHVPSGLPVHGYEIHHGQSKANGTVPEVYGKNGEAIGFRSQTEKVWGTYLHGIFDADEFRRWFIDCVRVRKGLSPIGCVRARYDLEPALDRLADAVRESVQMKEIYKILRFK
ncbi:MAG: cobyric acid synthase [Kiritimatiellia bacterium]|nr:cobyric acid synthase [Kiritimatiellia bacterium]